jgi:hypothetical protein
VKSLSRDISIALFFAFAIGSIYGCAEKPKPITFPGPGVQIWKMNIIYETGVRLLDQTLILEPSETEKNVFHVTAIVYQESEFPEEYRLTGKLTGEIRNGEMICDFSGVYSVIEGFMVGSHLFSGPAKGTFSKRRAAGNIRIDLDYRGVITAKWTAERIS